MEASAALIAPANDRKARRKGRSVGDPSPFRRSRPHTRAHGKEGVIGSSPMLGLAKNSSK
jgi:hypothetical protein